MANDQEIFDKLYELQHTSSDLRRIELVDDLLSNLFDENNSSEKHEASFDQLQKDLVGLQLRLNECEKTKQKYSSCLKSVETNINLFNLLNKRTIGIVGGHKTDAKNIRAMIQSFATDAKLDFPMTLDQSVPPHKTFREKYSNADLIITLTGFTGHALTEHAKKLENELKVPVIIYEKPPTDPDSLLLDIRLHLEK